MNENRWTCAPEDTNNTISNELSRLKNLSMSRPSVVEFYGQIVETVCRVTRSCSGFVWVHAQDQYRLIAAAPLLSRPDFETIDKEISGKIVVPTAEKGTASKTMSSDDLRVRTPRFPIDGESEESVFLESTYSLGGNSDSQVVLQLVQTELQESERSSQIDFISSIREIARDFHNNAELAKLRSDSGFYRNLLDLTKRLLACSDQRELDFELVNSTATLLQLDRVSKITFRDERYVVNAISGVSSINPGSQSSGEIINKVRLKRESERQSERAQDPESDSKYKVVELSGSVDDDRVENSYLLLESKEDARFANQTESSIGQICQVFQSVTRKTESSVNDHRSSAPFRKRLWATAIALIAVLVLWLYPANLKIRAAGSIHPKVERGVYAPSHGQILKVNAFHNKSVNKGDVLLVMRSADLEYKLSELRGAERATVEKIRAIEASYSKGENGDQDYQQNAALANASTIKELKIVQASQLERIAILESQEELLKIRSPIKGRIVTWQINQLLDDRQVKRGQLLLSVADTEGDWEARIEIRDHRVGRVLERIEQGETPSLEFLCISDPDTSYRGQLTRIEQNTVENIEGFPVVKATAEFELPNDESLRSGTRILARVNCGRRSLGYVWFHGFYESIVGSLF